MSGDVAVGEKAPCVHTSAAALYSTAFDRSLCAYSLRENQVFSCLLCLGSAGQQTCHIKSCLIPGRCFWPGAGACVSSIVLLISEHSTANCLVAFEHSALSSLPIPVGRVMPILTLGHSSPLQGLHCIAGAAEEGGVKKEGRY